MVLRIAAAFLFSSLAGQALACSCADVSRASPSRLSEFVAQAERVVHARVAQVPSPQRARIEVLESFKGAGETLEALRGNDANCGFRFQVGEEYVYFVFAGVVNLCGRVAPSHELLSYLRTLHAAAASCQDIPRPPRPAREPPIPEAPPPYEPLRGDDPDLALGVGHVRPAREEDRDDWPRRLWLPVFAAPEGELKLWLTPGSVGFDALVETGYETASFIALRARSDGWVQIRFGGPLASGAGWVHRCHLESATPRLEYEPWERLFASESAASLYFRAWNARNLRGAPATSGEVVTRIPADPNRYGMQPLEFRGDWARVRVSIPSTLCADPQPERAAVHEGWILWRARERGPAVWFYTRGC